MLADELMQVAHIANDFTYTNRSARILDQMCRISELIQCYHFQDTALERTAIHSRVYASAFHE